MSEKRLAVVTGAARGIGRAIVLELLKQGRIVAGLDLNAVQLEELVAVCKQQGHEVITKCIDITNSEKLTALLEELANQFGGIGILVNNAGITRDKLMIQMDDEDFDKVINVNLRAAFVATRVAARSMIRNKFGRIVSISSVAGVIGQAGSTNYAASKAGLIGFTQSVARELASRGITANALAPGFIETDMTAALSAEMKAELLKKIPLNTLGQVEDIAAAALFLASPAARYITGQVLPVDGGMAM